MNQLIISFLFSILFISPFVHAAPSSPTEIFDTRGVIWGFDFLDNNRIIFTTRDGKIGIFHQTKKTFSWATPPGDIRVSGQGGLLDVAVHAGEVYVTYSEKLSGGNSTTSLAKAKILGNGISPFVRIFRAKAESTNSHHYGSRVVFTDTHLFMSVGDRGERDKAQSLDFHNGKILRLNFDGTIPDGNPFDSAVWSYGHRNPQGLFYDGKTNVLYECEFGPRGGDEINVIEKGKNYGWPVITYGSEYYGPKIGEGTSKAGMEQPLVYYVPSISPSGMTVFQDDIYLANLSGQHVRKVVLDSKQVKTQTKLLEAEGERFRAIRGAPNGKLYVSTDSGKLYQLP